MYVGRLDRLPVCAVVNVTAAGALASPLVAVGAAGLDAGGLALAGVLALGELAAGAEPPQPATNRLSASDTKPPRFVMLARSFVICLSPLSPISPRRGQRLRTGSL